MYQSNNRCVYYPIRVTNTTSCLQKNITRITIRNDNEFLINSLLKKIPCYPLFFNTFFEASPIQIGQMTTTYLESTKPIKTTNPIVLLKYKKGNIHSFSTQLSDSNK